MRISMAISPYRSTTSFTWMSYWVYQSSLERCRGITISNICITSFVRLSPMACRCFSYCQRGNSTALSRQHLAMGGWRGSRERLQLRDWSEHLSFSSSFSPISSFFQPWLTKKCDSSHLWSKLDRLRKHTWLHGASIRETYFWEQWRLQDAVPNIRMRHTDISDGHLAGWSRSSRFT